LFDQSFLKLEVLFEYYTLVTKNLTNANQRLTVDYDYTTHVYLPSIVISYVIIEFNQSFRLISV